MRNIKKYHFIGIGGVSMSALALILLSQGHYVQGSDISSNEFTKTLKNNAVNVFFGHNKNNIGDCDTIVYSSAISESNEELVFAKEKSLKILTRAELLQKISSNYENVISVSGAHGKTTTTGMICETFLLAGKKPTAHIGGIVKSINSNFILGQNKYFITEACEYRNNFLHLKSKVGVILNVEPEHLDFFKTFENVKNAFIKYSENCEKIVMYQKVDIKHKNCIYYGNRGYNARHIKKLSHGKFKFACYYDSKKLFNIKLNVVGKHNIYNALACIAVCKNFDISNKIIKQSLKKFGGISRRYDIKKHKPFIVHDYAHHPDEISSVIEATRSFVKGKIIVVFQPHTYSRTKLLMDKFLHCFDLCDELMIIKTYSAREKYISSGSAFCLFNKLKKIKKKSLYFSNFESCFSYLLKNLKKSDTLLILGAGDIENLANMFEY